MRGPFPIRCSRGLRPGACGRHLVCNFASNWLRCRWAELDEAALNALPRREDHGVDAEMAVRHSPTESHGMTSRARRQAAERHLDKDFFPAILSCLSWKDQVKASLLCRDMLERVPDATWHTACHERYGECTNCSWFGRPPAPGRPGVLFDGPSIGRDRWLVGSRWTRGDVLCARLPVPPTAGAFSAQTRIAANDEYVVLAPCRRLW